MRNCSFIFGENHLFQNTQVMVYPEITCVGLGIPRKWLDACERHSRLCYQY